MPGAYIPNRALNADGFDHIVPFVTHERYLENVRVGVLVNMGFLPAEYRHPDSRRQLVRGTNQHFDMVGMVTRNKNLQKNTFFKGGNVDDEQRFSLRNFNLTDMAAFSSLSNRQNVSKAVIERVDVGVTGLDESNPMEYNVDLNTTQGVPYGKV